MSTTSRNTAEVYEITQLANESLNRGKPLEWDSVYMVRNREGEMCTITTGQKPGSKPRHKAFSQTVIDVHSFTRYLDKHGDGPETEIRIYGDRAEIVAVLDAGSKLNPGHEDHKITLKPQPDVDWLAWQRIDGDLLSQEDFADFIEDQALNIQSPDAATMLEIATSMQVATNVEFEQGHRQQDGQVRFAYREDSTTKAGANGDIEIPSTIHIALSPFKNGATYQVEARLRWRIRNKQLAIGVKLVRPDLVKGGAFEHIVEGVSLWNNTDDNGEERTTPRHLITSH